MVASPSRQISNNTDFSDHCWSSDRKLPSKPAVRFSGMNHVASYRGMAARQAWFRAVRARN